LKLNRWKVEITLELGGDWMAKEEKKLGELVGKAVKEGFEELGKKLQKRIDNAMKDLKKTTRKVDEKRRGFVSNEALLAAGVAFAIGLALGVALVKTSEKKKD